MQKKIEEKNYDELGFWRSVDGSGAPGWMNKEEYNAQLKDFTEVEHHVGTETWIHGLKVSKARFEEKTKVFPGMDKHLEQYHQYLAQGRKVVLVGYSQGSLYANAEANMLIASDASNNGKISVVGVASLSDYLMPNSSYFTSKSDVTIEYLRQPPRYPKIVSANLEMASAEDDPDGHSFVKTYMSPKSAMLRWNPRARMINRSYMKGHDRNINNAQTHIVEAVIRQAAS